MSENETKENFNSIIDDYIDSRKYDLRRIDRDHPLWQNISKTVKMNLNDETPADTYLEYAGVVFDDDSYNFHIFPNKTGDLNELNTNYANIQKSIKEKIDKKKDKVTWLNKCNISKGRRNFSRMNNINKCLHYNLESGNTIAATDVKIFNTHVSIDYNNSCYCLHLIRLKCDKKGVVGCTMQAIQFHRQIYPKNQEGIYSKKPLDINKNINGNFEICYPQTDKDIRNTNIEGNYYKKNSAGNVCYNPPVDWPINCNPETIEPIVKQFLDFVEKEGDIEKLKAKKWKIKRKTSQN